MKFLPISSVLAVHQYLDYSNPDGFLRHIKENLDIDTYEIPRPCEHIPFVVHGSHALAKSANVGHGVCLDTFTLISDYSEIDYTAIVYGKAVKPSVSHITWSNTGGAPMQVDWYSTMWLPGDFPNGQPIDSPVTMAKSKNPGAQSFVNGVEFGDHKDIKEKEINRITFHDPLFTPYSFSLVETEYYVPQWSKYLRTDEHYTVKNDGPPVKGGYQGSIVFNQSRRQLGRPPPLERGMLENIIYGFLSIVPTSTEDWQIFDRIGNITMSDMRTIEDNYVMRIFPRHILLGGWSGDWSIRYSSLLNSPSSSIIEIPSSPSIGNGWAHKRIVRVILPPFAEIESVEQAHGTHTHTDRVQRWFDIVKSRTRITLEFENIPMSAHGNIAVIKFKRTGAVVWAHAAWALVCATIIITAGAAINHHAKLSTVKIH